MNPTSRSKKYRLGIALGGGGAKGFAHVGVLRAMEDFGLKPQIVAGCSAGSVVGSLFSAGYSDVYRLCTSGVGLVVPDKNKNRAGALFCGGTA